jgi:hypothetical protein
MAISLMDSDMAGKDCSCIVQLQQPALNNARTKATKQQSKHQAFKHEQEANPINKPQLNTIAK